MNLEHDRAECANCCSVWPSDKLNEPADLWQRVDAGDETPAGECPRCGALCFALDEDESALLAVREIAREVTTRDGRFSETASAAFLVSVLKKYGIGPADTGPCRR